MKKVVLTISALLVSAAMIFSFAGCTKEEVNEEPISDSVVESLEDESNEAVDAVVEEVSESEADTVA